MPGEFISQYRCQNIEIIPGESYGCTNGDSVCHKLILYCCFGQLCKRYIKVALPTSFDLGTAQTKANNASASLAGFNANGTPFVWDGSSGVDLQNPNWLTKLIG